MRSANVLVTIHGSGSNNALFMAEGSTLVEIRPYQFGTKSHEWANTFMPQVGLLRQEQHPSIQASSILHASCWEGGLLGNGPCT